MHLARRSCIIPPPVGRHEAAIDDQGEALVGDEGGQHPETGSAHRHGLHQRGLVMEEMARNPHAAIFVGPASGAGGRSEEHTSELQSLMRISYAVFCLKKKKTEE